MKKELCQHAFILCSPSSCCHHYRRWNTNAEYWFVIIRFQEILTSDIIKCRDKHKRIHPKDVTFNLRKEFVNNKPEAFDGYLLIWTKESNAGAATLPTDITVHMEPSLHRKVQTITSSKVIQ